MKKFEKLLWVLIMTLGTAISIASLITQNWSLGLTQLGLILFMFLYYTGRNK